MKDAVGRQHYQAGASARVVSLVPSLTELLFDLGLQSRLVGRTNSCIEPIEEVKNIAVVGGTGRVDILALAELGPSHVLVSRDQTPKALTEEIINLGVEVVSTHCSGPEDVGALIDLLGDIFGGGEQAGPIQETLQTVITEAKAAASATERNAIFLSWKNPWITVSRDTYEANLMALAGFRIIGNDAEIPYPEIHIGPEILRQTDLILFGNDPFRFEDEDVEDFQLEHAIGSKPELVIVDARAITWPGKRAIEGLRELIPLARRL